MTHDVMVDVTGANLARIAPRLIAAVEAGAVRKVAGYRTGSPGIPWTSAEWAEWAPGTPLLDYDQTPGGVDFSVGLTLMWDDETGAGNPALAGQMIIDRKRRNLADHVIYGDDQFLAAAGASLAAAGLADGQVGCGLADWNLDEAAAAALIGTRIHGMTCRFVQWASPTSNPRTILPGTSLTLGEANCDLNAADPAWHPYMVRQPVPPKTLSGVSASISPPSVQLRFTDGSSRQVWP